MSIVTLKEDRPISAHEVEIVAWMLAYASKPLGHLADTMRTLRVIGRCSCGCPSVDFEINGQAPPNAPLAEATGRTPDNIEVGVILWGRPDALTGARVLRKER